MAFCAFDDSAALFDSTPVENMFITEYMLRAPGDFVKVYLYGLMQCYHPTQRMSIAAMAKDLDMTEDDVDRAFKYWARDGLVRQIGDNPVCYAFVNLKQLTLTQAKSPAEKLYNKAFADEIQRAFGKRKLSYQDYQTIYSWVDDLELPEEVVLMFLQSEIRKAGSNLSFKVATKRIEEWAMRGVRTVEDAEKIIMLSGEREKDLKRLLARLGQRRAPSDDEKLLYSKWIDEWGFEPAAIQEACRETTKGTPSMAYLDGILLRQHQLGRHEAQALSAGMAQEKNARDFARDVYQGLGRTGLTPTQEDLAAIEGWRAVGNSDEMILLAVAAAHRKTSGGNMDDVNAWLERWKRQGLNTPEDVKAYTAHAKALNAQLREIYDAAGMDKRTNAPDRELLMRWTEEMGMSMELVLLAAQYARGGGAPMLAMGRILSDWRNAGISSVQAAQAEHGSHIRGNQTARIQTQPIRGQAPMLRHEYTQEDYQNMVVDLDDEEE